MRIPIDIFIDDKDAERWRKKYGEDYVVEAIENEIQMFAENINDEVLEGYEDIIKFKAKT